MLGRLALIVVAWCALVLDGAAWLDGVEMRGAPILSATSWVASSWVASADAAPQKRGRRRKSRRRRPRKPAAAPAPLPPPPTPVTPAEPPAEQRGPTRIDFDDRLLQGQTNQSGAVVLFARKSSGLESMVRRRRSFRQRTLRTVFDR